MRHFYRLAGPSAGRAAEGWHTATAGYIYELLGGGDGAIFVAYHWHPIEGVEVDHPHLHIGRQFAHRQLPPEVRSWADRLVRSHLPTEPVVLPTVLRYAIVELGIEPLRGDWREVLDEAERSARASLPLRWEAD
jgi:hypothetical protein